jgi:hypothetical protein
VYPPGHKSAKLQTEPDAKGNVLGMHQWLSSHLPRLADTPLAPQECVQDAGDAIYLPPNWLHATYIVQDAIGVLVQHPSGDHLQDNGKTRVLSVSEFHYAQGTRLDDAQLPDAVSSEQQACKGAAAKVSTKCTEARLQLGMLLTYNYVKGQLSAQGNSSPQLEVEKALRGVKLLQRIKTAGPTAARARFVAGLTMAQGGSPQWKQQVEAVGGALLQHKEGIEMMLAVLDKGDYQPVCFHELFWSVVAYSYRIQGKVTRQDGRRYGKEDIMAAESGLIRAAELALTDADSEHELQVCKF